MKAFSTSTAKYKQKHKFIRQFLFGENYSIQINAMIIANSDSNFQFHFFYCLHKLSVKHFNINFCQNTFLQRSVKLNIIIGHVCILI